MYGAGGAHPRPGWDGGVICMEVVVCVPRTSECTRSWWSVYETGVSVGLQREGTIF